MAECCENCYYSRANDETSITCCRYPPAITRVDGKQVTTFFPLLRHEAWCGEWRAAVNGHTDIVNNRYDTETVPPIQSRNPRRKS